MPIAAQAAPRGLLGGSALLFGAAPAWLAAVPARLAAAVMTFESGVPVSALSFELMNEAYHQGGFDDSIAGPSPTPSPTSPSRAAAALLGNVAIAGAGPGLVAAVVAVAAGAVVAVAADPKGPGSLRRSTRVHGAATVARFLAAFVLSKLGG